MEGAEQHRRAARANAAALEAKAVGGRQRAGAAAVDQPQRAARCAGARLLCRRLRRLRRLLCRRLQPPRLPLRGGASELRALGGCARLGGHSRARLAERALLLERHKPPQGLLARALRLGHPVLHRLAPLVACVDEQLPRLRGLRGEQLVRG